VNAARRQEEAEKVVLTEGVLCLWFGDALLQAVNVRALALATVIDLLRILDYPGEFVLVVPRRQLPAVPGDVPAEAPPDLIQVVDKSALNSHLSQSYVTELMDRARIA
jgi:hypothetical protein